MKKEKTIHDIIKNCLVGDILSDGKRTWKVVESFKEGGECVIATPHNWDKKHGKPFELWDDAQARVSSIPGLKVNNAIS